MRLTPTAPRPAQALTAFVNERVACVTVLYRAGKVALRCGPAREAFIQPPRAAQ